MKKTKKGLLVNYFSVAIMAASGLIMTSAVRYFYDSSSLGIFNESYAWYMILSQVSVWGIHMSVLKYIPEQRTDEEKGEVLISSLLASLMISLPLLLILEIIVWLLYNLAWRTSLLIALVGLPFMSLNKILLNYLNAILDFIGFAVIQSLRYLMLAAGIAALSANKLNSDYLTIVFPAVETAVCSAIALYIGTKKSIKGKPKKKWIFESLDFGAKILPSNMVLEMNSKVDVVCLGLILNDTAKIGVYSYAILFTEGLYYIYYTLRKVINPRISSSKANSNLMEYIKKVQVYQKKYFAIGSIVSLFVVEFVYFLICMIFGSEEYYIGLLYICIIGVSITLNGKSIIWGDFLSQTGYPVEESKVNLWTIMSNIICNIILIYFFGTVGAAIGTYISYFVYRVFQNKYILETSGMKL